MLLELSDRVELRLAAQVAKPLAVVITGVQVPRFVTWVRTVIVAVSVPDEISQVCVVMAALLALP